LIPSSKNKTSSTNAASTASWSRNVGAERFAVPVVVATASNAFKCAFVVIQRGNAGDAATSASVVVAVVAVVAVCREDMAVVGLRATGVVNASSCLRDRGERR
jgi:hypothetical protein